MEIGIVKFQRRGTVAVPLELRQGLKPGDALIVSRQGDLLVYQKASAVQGLYKAKIRTVGKEQASKAHMYPKMPKRGPDGKFLPAKKKSVATQSRKRISSRPSR